MTLERLGQRTAAATLRLGSLEFGRRLVVQNTSVFFSDIHVQFPSLVE
jgi:hypothetical protein